jgi:hypothetical protein
MIEFNTRLALYWLGFFSSFSFIQVAFGSIRQLPPPLLPFPLAIIFFLLMGVIPFSIMTFSIMTNEFDINEVIEGSKRGIISGLAFLIGIAIATNFF